jgi:HD-GYP domain-containing protein (c-di-GMP phosphodiesterase class II)
VAVLTRKLAEAMGISRQDVETYYVSALVHDVGKIGVPEAVLSKLGKLDEVEYQWIKRHPEIGYRILKDIPAMEAMLPGVLHHHERWDGRGYPNGLAGEQIPLIARVIAFADTFDAMSSMRSYRPALPRDQILAEIGRCAGTQFDPALAEVFLGLDFTEFYSMLHVAASKSAA